MCSVRDRSAEFHAVGAQPVGIGRDPVAAQLRFAEENGFGFPLWSDADGAVCTAYGVDRAMASAPVMADVVRSEFRFGTHAATALDTLRG